MIRSSSPRVPPTERYLDENLIVGSLRHSDQVASAVDKYA